MMSSSNTIFISITMMLATTYLTSPQRLKVFECGDGLLINALNFCDGTIDCIDGSDEISSDNVTMDTKHFGGIISCNNNLTRIVKICDLRYDYVCDDVITCKGVTKCDIQCDTHYLCSESTGCASRKSICDGSACGGCQEDHEWKNGIGFKCWRNGKFCVLPQQLTWDNISDCDANVDRCFEVANSSLLINKWDLRSDEFAKFNQSRCFKCFDDVTIIPRSSVCDGIIDCPDLSDECMCKRNQTKICSSIKMINSNNIKDECSIAEFVCTDGDCIDRRQICNGIADCSQAEDESFDSCKGTKPCAAANENDKSCRCSLLLENKFQSCDRLEATPCDEVEECVPTVSGIMAEIFWVDDGYPDDECAANCLSTHHNYTCGTNKTIVTAKSALHQCQPKDPNVTGFVDFTSLDICNGHVLCKEYSDEISCPDRFPCVAGRGELISIPNQNVCDGIIDCDHGDDEVEASCAEKRFSCNSQGGKLVSIDKRFVCDLYIHCDGGEDESNCTHVNDRFYCEGGQPMFVPIRKIKNGFPDCVDWSDECPSQGQFNTDSVFSSKKELIANLFLRVWIWIMAVLAIIGNTVVLMLEIKNLRTRKVSAALRANRVLVVNLALADLLMGIYLLALAIKTTMFSGKYCSMDLEWRSSVTCIALGVISTMSSEGSIFIMILLTACRLYAVYKPHFSYVKPSKRVVIAMVTLAWIFALLLALIPLSPQQQNIFIDKAVYSQNPFDETRGSSFSESKEMLLQILSIENVQTEYNFTIQTWGDIETNGKLLSKHPEFFDVIQYFGYYGHSVCIQKFFVKTSNAAWKYSLFVNILNFTAFVFVTGCYVAVYMKARKTSGQSRTRRPKDGKIDKMQRRIFRLVATDFCCWVPITIMAFVQLGTGSLSDDAYAFAAIILLPINSTLNPILYSDLWDKLIKRLEKFQDEHFTMITLSTRTTSDQHSKNTSTTHVNSTKSNKTENIHAK